MEDMREIFAVFRKKEAWWQMILSAVVFFAIALPFRSMFTLLPGVTEIRPANMVPIVFGIQFGPSAAWGISVGNLISDIISGSNAFICISGFITNFFYSYIPYKLWYTLRVGKDAIHPVRLSRVIEIVKYIIIVFIDSFVTTVSLSLVFDSAGFQSFSSSFPLLFFNNFDFAIILGIPVLVFWKKLHLPSVVPESLEHCGKAKSEALENSDDAKAEQAENCDSAKSNSKAKKNARWLDAPLYAISAIGVGYFIYSLVTGGDKINSSLALAFLCVGFIGLFIYTFRPTETVEPLTAHSESVRISIRAKVVLGFLLVTLIFLVLLGVASYTALTMGGELERLKVWNYIYLVLGISINLLYGIVILFLWYVEKNITTPIEHLSDLTELYARDEDKHDGDISKRIQELAEEVPQGDEIGALAVSFRNMVGELDEYMVNLASVTADKERIATELNIATQIQLSMLPCLFPAFPDRDEIDIYATMTPAKEVGGDFYDFFMVDDRHLAIVMADVSGKGVPAALFMVIGKTLIKDHTQPGRDLGEVFTEVNNILCESNDNGMFITAFEGVLDLATGEFRYVNAGHEMPFVYRKNGEYEAYKIKPGFVLAGMEDIKYKEHVIQLNVGDKIFQYTDGVTEATDVNNGLYGMDRLSKVLNERCADADPKETLEIVKSDIDAFVGSREQFDDITMLCLEYVKEMEG